MACLEPCSVAPPQAYAPVSPAQGTAQAASVGSSFSREPPSVYKKQSSASLSLSGTVLTCILLRLSTLITFSITQILLVFLPSLPSPLPYLLCRITSQINLLHQILDSRSVYGETGIVPCALLLRPAGSPPNLWLWTPGLSPHSPLQVGVGPECVHLFPLQADPKCGGTAPQLPLPWLSTSPCLAQHPQIASPGRGWTANHDISQQEVIPETMWLNRPFYQWGN